MPWFLSPGWSVLQRSPDLVTMNQTELFSLQYWLIFGGGQGEKNQKSYLYQIEKCALPSESHPYKTKGKKSWIQHNHVWGLPIMQVLRRTGWSRAAATCPGARSWEKSWAPTLHTHPATLSITVSPHLSGKWKTIIVLTSSCSYED